MYVKVEVMNILQIFWPRQALLHHLDWQRAWDRTPTVYWLQWHPTPLLCQHAKESKCCHQGVYHKFWQDQMALSWMGRWPCTKPARRDRWSRDSEPSCQRPNDMTSCETLWHLPFSRRDSRGACRGLHQVSNQLRHWRPPYPSVGRRRRSEVREANRCCVV